LVLKITNHTQVSDMASFLRFKPNFYMRQEDLYCKIQMRLDSNLIYINDDFKYQDKLKEEAQNCLD